MSTENLTATLIKKMEAEQDRYRAWLTDQPPAEILKYTREYVIRENILIALKERDLTTPQAEMLLSSTSPLADIYQDWSKQHKYGSIEEIRGAIEGHADTLIRQDEELRKSPVYKYPFEYAKENNELDQYRASHKVNIDCKKAIESAITNHHSGFTFDSRAAVHDVVEKFGYERTLRVLAATVRDKVHDGRFSNSSKDWSRTIPIFDDVSTLGRDFNRDFVVQSHPALTEDFVTTARHEYLLSLPLTRDDIKAEALNILSKFQNAREPNSPNGTHYMAQVSPDFLARAGTKDTDRLIAMLPFKTLCLSGLEGRRGTFALISQDENRFQKLVLRKPSVRKKLQEKSDTLAAPKSPGKNKTKGQER